MILNQKYNNLRIKNYSLNNKSSNKSKAKVNKSLIKKLQQIKIELKEGHKSFKINEKK
jgi:hypothetical protein